MRRPLHKTLPPLVLVVAIIYVAGAGLDRPLDDQFDLNTFAQLPVVHGGRVKPMDSLAGHALMIISKRRYYEDAAGERQPAVRWLLDTMSHVLDNPAADQHQVFRIDNEDVIAALNLPTRKRFRYAHSEFEGRLRELASMVIAAEAVPPDERSLFQHKVIELGRQLDTYTALWSWHEPHAVPPGPDHPEWQTLFDATHGAQAGTETHPAARTLQSIFAAWVRGDAATFNQQVNTYHTNLQTHMPRTTRKAALEHRFNVMRPFHLCASLYVVIGLLVSFGWMMRSATTPVEAQRGGERALLRSAAWLTMFVFALHTAALLARMYLQGRPPVTNLYSSAVFVGWGAVVVAIVLEWLFRNGIGTLTAAALGFATLIVAINLEIRADGETLEMMQAVLDTNFWLATHVTTVTLGYSATFMAGFLGILFIFRGLFTRTLSPEESRNIARMIYGVVCFALLFSFVGTVLGGIWADQSWGRFWGWDPKENGALIIVIWNALILHARWGGMIRLRGLAVLAVAGNIITAWSWFGTNLLGVGLHAYGFIEQGVYWMLVFVAANLLIILLGVVPIRYWRSPMVMTKDGRSR